MTPALLTNVDDMLTRSIGEAALRVAVTLDTSKWLLGLLFAQQERKSQPTPTGRAAQAFGADDEPADFVAGGAAFDRGVYADVGGGGFSGEH